MNQSEILERYPDAEKIKEGGQKQVFRVQDSTHGLCVLKVGKYSTPRSLERIEREVETLRNLDSKYYPDNYAFEVLEDQSFYILEEYIESIPLSNRDVPIVGVDEVTEFILNLIEGLCILWEKRIIHRDIKPDNVLLRENGNPVIIDLGIAKLKDLESLTRTLAVRGPCTPVYAAPEQLSNRKSQIDWRTDQFNVGIMMAELLLDSRHPFDPTIVGEGESTVANIIDGRWAVDELESKADRAVEPISRMLMRHPYQRYRKPEYMIEALEEIL